MTSRVAQARIALRLRLALRGPAATDEDRARRLRSLRAHAVARSPAYAELHRGCDDAPLEALPTVTKDDIVDRFDHFVTDRRLRYDDLRRVLDGGQPTGAARRYRVGVSSGSSGRPGVFPFDEREWVGLLANAARARALAGRPVGRTAGEGPLRTARITSPSPWHLSRQVGETLHDPRKPSLTLSAATDVRDIAHQLDRWQPDILSGYPSVLAALAELTTDGDLSIRPAQVFTGGERLTDATRRRIEAAWGTRPFDQYLTTEAGFVAIECAVHDGMHVLEDHVVVEVVDVDGNAVPDGTPGHRVLVTVLGSRTLPLIRYELGDTATRVTGPCDCGSDAPRVTSVASRSRDLLRLPGRSGTDVVVHPVAFTAVLDPAPVREWQIVVDRDVIRVRVAGPGLGFRADEVIAALGHALDEAGAKPRLVEVVEVDHLSRTGSGKASLVITDERWTPAAEET